MSVVRDPEESLVLSEEILGLLAKDAIKPVGKHTQPSGVYSVYC